MDIQIQAMQVEKKDQLVKLFTTVYHVAKLELPFAAFPSLVALQQTNGGGPWTDTTRIRQLGGQYYCGINICIYIYNFFHKFTLVNFVKNKL